MTLQPWKRRVRKVELIPGDERLHKITYPEDFDLVAKLMSPAVAVPRVGKGFDVHAFEPGDHVTLCGVAIPHTAKLKGHSDADAAWHALTDAILGAVALGDIGDHFPPSDARWKNADSAIFLQEAIRLAGAEGYAVSSCDITVICEAPKVKPHREAMRSRTAELMGLPLSGRQREGDHDGRIGLYRATRGNSGGGHRGAGAIEPAALISVHVSRSSPKSRHADP